MSVLNSLLAYFLINYMFYGRVHSLCSVGVELASAKQELLLGETRYLKMHNG